MSNAAAVEALFFAALEIESAAGRAAFLGSTCRNDPELRRQVEKLLNAHPRVGNFLIKPIFKRLAEAAELADATQELGGSAGGPCDNTALEFLQPPTVPDSLGRIGRYEILQVLGRGGFGIVFRAFDEVLHRVVAVKVLAPQLAATSPARKRFLREAQSSARVRHENVVQMYEVGEQPLPHIVMEFIPGETLQQRLDRAGPLEVPEVLRIGRQLAEGLAAAHAQGLIHRDVKPANVLLEAGPTQRVKITDFGLARAADDATSSQSGLVAGTPMYMSPEQASGEALDHRTDLFSLGSVLYVMTSGRPPFRAKTPLAVFKRVVEHAPRPITEIIPETPQWLCDVIARLHAKKPEERFGTAREVADLLARRLEHLQRPEIVEAPTIAAPAAQTVPPPSQESPQAAPTIRPRFRPARLAVAAAMLLALLGGLGVTEATGVTRVRGTVVRLFYPDGTLVVEVDDPDVSVTIEGADVVIRGAGVKEIRLKPGSYKVEASKDGKPFHQELVTVTKNGKQTVRVSKVARPPDDPDRRAAEFVLSVGRSRVECDGDDRDVRAVADLPKEAFLLTGFGFSPNKQVDDLTLAVFKSCKHLKHLSLFGCGQITDSGLVHFKDCKNLTLIDLNATPITDAGLLHFRDCKNLKILSVPSTRVTDAGLANLGDYKNLASLSLIGTAVTDAGLAHLGNCKNLTFLWLAHTAVTDAGLAHLEDCKNLKLLNVEKTKVTAAGIDKLKKALPKCKIEWDGGVIPPG